MSKSNPYSFNDAYPNDDLSDYGPHEAYEMGVSAGWDAGKEAVFQHDSDCALHNEPAYPAEPCDCSVRQRVTAALLPPDHSRSQDGTAANKSNQGYEDGKEKQ